MPVEAMARATPDQWITLHAISLHADAAGALLHEGERALLVADLHLEKGSAFARRGQMLPPFDTAATLAKLAALLMRHRPRVVIALGDSFHDRFGWSRMAPADRDALTALQAGRDWIWISGNHDPVLPDAVGGERHAFWRLGPLMLRHEPAANPPRVSGEGDHAKHGGGAHGLCPSGSHALATSPQSGEDRSGEIAGHFHPVAKVGGQRRRCFVTDGTRLVMPAFGAYAGGLNLHDSAIASLFTGRRIAHVLGRDRVYAVCASKCTRD